MNVLEYFNLRERERVSSSVGDGALLVWEEETAGQHSRRSASGLEPQMPWWEQIVMYVGVVAGVFFSSYVLGNGDSFSSRWKGLGVSCIVALVIIPAIHSKLRVPKGAPFIVKLGLFVQNGVFWHTLLAGVTKALGRLGSGP